MLLKVSTIFVVLLTTSYAMESTESVTETSGVTTDAASHDVVIKTVRSRLKVRRNKEGITKDRPESEVIKNIFVKGPKQPNQVIRNRISANKSQEATFENQAKTFNKRVLEHPKGIIRSRIPPIKSQDNVLTITEVVQGSEGVVEGEVLPSVVPPKLESGRFRNDDEATKVQVSESADDVIKAASDVIQARIDVVEEQPSVRLRVVELEMFKCHRGCMLSKNRINSSNETDEDDLLIQQCDLSDLDETDTDNLALRFYNLCICSCKIQINQKRQLCLQGRGKNCPKAASGPDQTIARRRIRNQTRSLPVK